ncbi:uncharacterized protein LOC131637892 isoform X2 [Vicia villosa]|uniref:uncharacterized protein LOC131637892 isoform X2 n=1 Tax=Vicia villosa TaxID=3911 RepID=UPI00273C09DF|nr:uncharacterized protein LOC131637892 isoform X2 [Vicia villosa]
MIFAYSDPVFYYEIYLHLIMMDLNRNRQNQNAEQCWVFNPIIDTSSSGPRSHRDKILEKRSLEAKMAKLNSLMIDGITNKDPIGANDSMVLSGKVQCCKQIVALSSDEGKVIVLTKSSL